MKATAKLLVAAMAAGSMMVVAMDASAQSRSGRGGGVTMSRSAGVDSGSRGHWNGGGGHWNGGGRWYGGRYWGGGRYLGPGLGFYFGVPVLWGGYYGYPYWNDYYEGCYINYPDIDMLAYPFWPELFYGEQGIVPMLRSVKRRYDPNNIFHHAMSISA